MKKTILISILAILLIASFITLQTNEITITKEQYTNSLVPNPTPYRDPTSIYETFDIISGYNVWVGPDSLKIDLESHLEFYDENGTYHECPSGNAVCESKGMDCAGLGYKYNDDPWGFTDEPVYEEHPCEWNNMAGYIDSTSTVFFPPYGKYYEGFDRKWNNWPIGDVRGARYYNITPLSATKDNVTVQINKRFEENRPEIQVIPLNDYRIFTSQEDILFYVRGINLEEQTINITTINKGRVTYRAVCVPDGYKPKPILSATKTLKK